MNHPAIKTTVELSKTDKLKLLKDRLATMLKDKNIDPLKITTPANNTPASQGHKNTTKPQNNQQKIQKKSSKQKEEEGDDKLENNKSKKIKKEMKNEKILRKAAGQVWEDKTMEDWPESDYRIFCGNLGNEVTDDILGSIFRRYSSFQMGRVVRDRRTGKTRGYGFVSFLNPTDFLNALKQMNGKHVGNRPVKLMKSSWKDRNLKSAKNQFLPSDFQKNSQKQTFKICVDYKYVSPY